ncbi:MAG: ABC transporter ATP-binding protein [Patescibacteria group bacterium]
MRSKEFASIELTKQEILRRKSLAKKEKDVQPEASPIVEPWLDLRQSLQAVLEAPENQPEQKHHPKLLSELLETAPELQKQHQAILHEMSMIRGYVDLEQPELKEHIDAWIADLRAFLAEKNVKKRDFEPIESAGRRLFVCVANALTTRSLERDIRTQEQMDWRFRNTHQRPQALKTLKTQLEENYPYSPEDVHDLVDLFLSDEMSAFEALKKALPLIARIWKQYDLGNQAGNMGAVSLGVILTTLLRHRRIDARERLAEGGKFQTAVLLEQLISEFVTVGGQVLVRSNMEKFNNHIKLQIQRRMTESLFYRRFEFSQETGQDHKTFTTVQRGEEGVRFLLQELAKNLLPTFLSLGLSAVAMTRASALLSPVGFATIPLVIRVEKMKQRALEKLADSDEIKSNRIQERLSAYKQGLEELKTSPDAEHIVEQIMQMMKDLARDEYGDMATAIKRDLWNEAPGIATYAVVGSVGAVLQRFGLVKGKDIMTTIGNVEALQRPVTRLVELLGTRITHAVRDIEEMEALLGNPEDLDRPNGPKEQARKPLDPHHQDIILDGLSYSAKQENLEILRDVHLEIKQGDYVVLAGRTGSGKSTILRHLTGLLEPDKGEIRIGGTPVKDIKRYGPNSLLGALAYSNQDPVLFPQMTVRENLMIWMPTETRTDEEIRMVLTKLGLERYLPRLDQPLTYASGGEKVRLGLARMFLKRASILILDEPTSKLDSATAEEMRGLLRDLHQQNPKLTIICVTHDEKLMEEIRRSGDPRTRIVHMEEINKITRNTEPPK